MSVTERKRPITQFFGAISDITIALTGLAIIGLQVADLIGALDLPWFEEKTASIVLLLLGLMILYAVIDRRVSLDRQHGEAMQALNILIQDRLATKLHLSGVRNIYTSRSDYQKYRGQADLYDYLATARSSIHILAHWLAHGVGLEGVPQKLARLIVDRPNFSVTIAIVNPDGPLLSALGAFLAMSPEEARSRARHSRDELLAARNSLNQAQRERFTIKLYDSLPVSSTIMLDVATSDGRIQVDYKTYQAPRQSSFGLEIQRNDTGLYDRFSEATLKQIADASECK